MPKRQALIKKFRVTSVRITEVSLTSIYEDQIDITCDELEPSNVLMRKTEALAELLGCTEEEAERIVLSHQ